MMKIIAVYGVNDSGKSASVKRFVDEVATQNKFTIIRNERFGMGNDILCIADYKNNNKNVRVGIVSQGDKEEVLNKAFSRFSSCDIVICACRTKGGSEKFLEEKVKANDDYVLWIGKSRISLWKGNQTKNGVKILQDSAEEFIAKMIYSAFLLLLEMG